MNDAAPTPAPKPVDELTFEQAQAELEHVVERLEDQHTGLDEAIALWERGEALHAYCQRRLADAATRIERLQVTPEEAAAVVAEGGDDFAAQPPEAAPVPEPEPAASKLQLEGPRPVATKPATQAADGADEPVMPSIF